MNTGMINKWKLATGEIICSDIRKAGSGFFINDRGFFITNNHVVTKTNIDETGAIRVDYSRQIFIKIAGNTYRASLVIDENSDRPVVYDYAILRVNVTPNAYFDIADLSEISPGEEAVALGYPLDFNELIVTIKVLSLQLFQGQVI